MADIIELPVRSYRDLRVWQESKALVLDIYKATQTLPQSELYGLITQMRRAAVSVPSNIAEGNARSTKEYIRFIDIALGSLAELETQIEIALELQFLDKETTQQLLMNTDKIGKMLRKLTQSLKAKNPSLQPLAPSPQS